MPPYPTEAYAAQARTLINYGTFLAVDRRYRDAKAALERGILIAERVLGDTHPDHISALETWVFLQRSRGRWKEARSTEKRIAVLRSKADRSGGGIDFARMMDVLENLRERPWRGFSALRKQPPASRSAPAAFGGGGAGAW